MNNLGILTLTHSSRSTDLHRCSINYLTQRYADTNRLLKIPRFEELQPQTHEYTGSVSFFRVLEKKSDTFCLRYIGSIKKKEKIQHTVQLNKYDFLIGYDRRLEKWKFRTPVDSLKRITKTDYIVEKKFEHPYFPGLHTAYKLSQDSAVISSSAADAVLILNINTGKVEKVLRMPSKLYGNNYHLKLDMDLHEHYITNDFQTTHINSAYPMQNGQFIVVSTLIQGAIGIFDRNTGHYKELIRGFIGCHGARVNDKENIYFADSVNGALIILNKDGRIIKHFTVKSRWLHDVQQISGDIYAFSIADLNEIRVYNIKNGQLFFRKKFLVVPYNRITQKLYFFLGNSVQFFSYYPL